MTDNTAPKIMYCAPSEAGGWADAHAGDWPSPANPNDTQYMRFDLHRAEVDALVAAKDAEIARMTALLTAMRDDRIGFRHVVHFRRAAAAALNREKG